MRQTTLDDQVSVPLASAVLPGTPPCVGAARRLVRAALAPHVPEESLDTAVLLTSELVTNTILHRGDRCALELWVGSAGRVRISVSDLSGAPGHPLRSPHAAPSPDAEGGRGLWLLDQLADAWGSRTSDTGGTETWFELRA